jgi:cyclopropane fatty-acyl-phospholipid synthase-like methyltransferase
MPFTQDHWKNPRHTIATKYEHDDFAYAIHGAWQAVEVLQKLNLKPSEAKTLSLLDYGCGTGRISRVLAKMFGKVVGYDPVKETIACGLKEGANLPSLDLVLTSDWKTVENQKFDIAISVNVIEHLSEQYQDEMLSNLKRVTDKNSRLLIWYCMERNKKMMEKHFGEFVGQMDEGVRVMNPSQLINIREFRGS